VHEQQRRPAAERGIFDRAAGRLRQLAAERGARRRGVEVALVGDVERKPGERRQDCDGEENLLQPKP